MTISAAVMVLAARTVFVNATIIGDLVYHTTLVTALTESVPMTSLGLIILTATGGSTNMQSAPDKESALAILALANAFLVMKVKPANVKLVPTLALVTEDVSTSKTLAMLQLHSTLLVSGIDGDDSNEAKYFTTAWGGVGTQQVGAVLGGSAPGYVAGDADTRRRLDEYVDYSRGPLQISYDGISNMDMMGGVLPGDFFEQEPYNKFPFHHWDKSKSTSCVCDPEWGDFDCSKRMCPYGNDVMDHRNNMARAARYQVQSIELFANDPLTDSTGPTYGNSEERASPLTHLRTFALTFKSKLNETFTTIPIVLITEHTGFHNFIKSVKDALESLPNRVIDRVDVAGDTNGVDLVHLNLTFTGEHVQGPQNLVSVKANLCGDGCTPKLTGLELRNQWETILEVQNSDFNSFECGRRGKCDYTTGVCNCFEGYTGLACNTITALV